jgi:acyl-CoA thioesterase-1
MRGIIGLLVTALSASAAQAQVVALGSSNTRGYDLPASDSYPARLEALLRAKGYNVSVTNAGINGDTSEGMLNRLNSATPSGTRVVVLDCCGNDNKLGGGARFFVADHYANVRTLVQRIKAKGIEVVFLPDGYQGEKDTAAAAARAAGAHMCGGMLKGVPEEHRRPSAVGTHADPIGYDIVAHRVLGCVMQELGKHG